MIKTTALTYNSFEEILENLDKILEVFIEKSVVCLRGVNLNYEDQLFLARALGDMTGGVPNNSSNFEQKYVESHPRIEDKESISGEEVALWWHMEHVEYDKISPIVGGVWNMTKFTAPAGAGKTYFYDTSKLYQSMNQEDQEFLQDSIIFWTEGVGNDYYSPAVADHWLTQEKTIRMFIGFSEGEPGGNLFQYKNREPSIEEKNNFIRIRNLITKTIFEDEERRIVHEWEQGDLIIADLFKGAHAATGGFSSEQREFIGLWLYPHIPDSEEYHKMSTEVGKVN